MKEPDVNELHAHLLGPNSLNPFHGNTSSSRGQMFSTHLGQRLAINGATPRAIQTGMERQYGSLTFKVDMPCRGLILDIIPRYQTTTDVKSIPYNPQTLVIYEDVDTRVIGCFVLSDYCSNHQYFGFRYAQQPGMNQLRIGNTIEKGTVFLDSPAITNAGDYAYGIQANVAYMTHPATAEDGILIRRSFLPKLGFRTYETRTIEWGREKSALNLYGTLDDPRPFPEIGSYIREDGLVMCLRGRDAPELALVERSIYDSLEPDYTFDDCVYAAPGGRVIDVRVTHHSQDTNIAEHHADGQAQRYDAALRAYYHRIMTVWKKYHKLRGDSLKLTPEFENLMVLVTSFCNEGKNQRVYKIYRNAPMDIYSVNIVIEYDIIPTTGFKLTDCFGG